MDAAKIFESIALLIDLAQRGEIDPWDVQVIEVIDRYLSKLFSADEATQAAREANLSQSGQAFLSASMLVLFKAKTLIELEQREADDLDPSEDDFLPEVEDGTPANRRLPLEQQLSRRSAALPPEKRRVTLQELIEQLQLMAHQLQLQNEANALSTNTTRTARHRSQSRTGMTRATLELAHQENLTQVARELEQFLNRHSQRILEQKQDWLNLEQLVELWTLEAQAASVASSTQHGNKAKADAGSFTLPADSSPEESEHFLSPRLPPQPHDIVSVFWALLLLSAQSKVELSQDEFYQDIKIRTLEAD